MILATAMWMSAPPADLGAQIGSLLFLPSTKAWPLKQLFATVTYLKLYAPRHDTPKDKKLPCTYFGQPPYP
ncbi:hypothetical protein DER46DRAFT_587475 [Fusarium sp. MPI-SDFR-AT-0072]|nr:hypothetical protein DER46DRAFT_587475 [Fusarium sp. MPI-SDFR-AT-0072]